jgi:large subunit ribosomal protein L4e
MKVKIINTAGEGQQELELPEQFAEPVRTDLIKKAVLAIHNNTRQAYGSFQEAGKRGSTDVSKRRRDYRGSYGKGISRVPRKVLSRRGSQFNWVGAEAPGMVGGRRAHPPKAEKVWEWKLNDKERRKAIRSAMSATMDRELVLKRGHKVPATYPFILDSQAETIAKTAQLREALVKLGFEADLERGLSTSVRAGVGKLRGRSKKARRSVLIVASQTGNLLKAASNLPGVDVINIKKLNAHALAPGGHCGRATLYTSSAIDELKKGLFTGKKMAQPEKPAQKTAPKNAEKKPAAKKAVKKA